MSHSQRINQIQKMLELEGEDIFLWYALGLEYQSISDWENAKKIFYKIIDKKSDYLPVYYQLAQLLERLNEEDEAISIYKKGMELAKQLGELKTFNELKSALEELEF